MECIEGCRPLNHLSSQPRFGTYDGVTGLVDLQGDKRLGDVERDEVKARSFCNFLVNSVLAID